MTSELAPAARRPTAPTVAGSGTAPTFEFEPHNCFACGTLNEHGLQLTIHLGERRSWTDLTLDDRFEGWVGIAHGGIVATILDEVMAWSLVAEDSWGVTARMSIEYRRPIPVGTPIRAEGWLVRTRKRIVETAARIVDRDGTVLASAEGTYLAADAERKRELQARYGYRVAAARAGAPTQLTATDPAAGTPESVDGSIKNASRLSTAASSGTAPRMSPDTSGAEHDR